MLDSGELITLRLCPSAQTYNILKAKLYEHSGFFRGLFACSTENDTLQPIDLNDTSAKVLQGIIANLYDQVLSFDNHDYGYGWSLTDDLAYLVDLYLFADKYDFQQVRNSCIKTVYEAIQRDKDSSLNGFKLGDEIWPPLAKAFTGLPPTAKLHQLLLTWLCAQMRRMGDGK